ncbi:FHA domain-containing protein [Actinomycetospora sp. CA-101289]|uniref:FHA domain-containing protein n=1 Tax=Actinomycetospora sp. CA-101289 TaxID=3239893 RepID=UPI003D95849E
MHVRRDFPYCLRCGALRPGASVAEFAPPTLVYRVAANGMREQRATLDGASTTIGRDDENDVVLDDPSVSRHHATITRTGAGYVVEDHGSYNGTTVTPLGRGEQEVTGDATVALADHATVHVGDVAVLFDQPRSGVVADRTQVKDIAGTVLGKTTDGEDEPPPATEPLAAVPRRRSGWALKQIEPDRWVLRNTRTGSYLSLDDRDVFLWHRLDGENSMRDLLFAYLEEYGELALPRIEATVRTLHQAGLVRGLPGDVEETTFWKRFGRAVIKNLIRVELSVKRLDPIAEKIYHGVAWRFFTLPAVVLLWALAIGGLVAFVRASSEQLLFDFGGAGIVGLVATFAGYVVATTLHELAHALAVKSYGRRVNRGGFLLMMGMPFAFVDTSDMWFGTSWSRIVVAVSGPLTTVGLAGGASIAALSVPDPTVAGICFTLAAGLYLNTLFNLIPLVPLDGYQALADALRTPRLKEEAKAYFGGGFLKDLRAGRRPGPKQVGLLVFGVLSAICLWAMIALSVMTWNSRLGGLAREYVAQPWLTILVVLVIALIVFPVWFPRARTIVRRMKERRAARTSPADAGEVTETETAPGTAEPAPEPVAEPAAGGPAPAPATVDATFVPRRARSAPATTPVAPRPAVTATDATWTPRRAPAAPAATPPAAPATTPAATDATWIPARRTTTASTATSTTTEAAETSTAPGTDATWVPRRRRRDGGG